jgi:Transposase IS66 family/Transposase/zinc-finger binding domain of transposase IS66
MTNAQVEVITSVQRRRRGSSEEKRRIVVAAIEPGAVASEVARAAGIHVSQLFRWRQQLCGGARDTGVFAGCGCAGCGGVDVVPRQWFVTEHVREKFSCRACQKITQPPFHAIARGFAGPSLLAMILVDKYANHQPLNRQSEQYERGGANSRSRTMADHVGACAAVLMLLYELIKAHGGRADPRRRNHRAGAGQGQDPHRTALDLRVRRPPLRRRRSAGGGVLLLAPIAPAFIPSSIWMNALPRAGSILRRWSENSSIG